MPRLTLIIVALTLVLAAPLGATESKLCADFRAKLAIEHVALSALRASQNGARAGKPQVQAHWEAFFGAATERRSAAGKVAAAITDKAARAVLDSAIELETKSSTLNRAIVAWKWATGRQWEGLEEGKPEQVFAPLSEAQADLWSAAVTAYHETLKAACRIGQVAR